MPVRSINDLIICAETQSVALIESVRIPSRSIDFSVLKRTKENIQCIAVRMPEQPLAADCLNGPGSTDSMSVESECCVFAFNTRNANLHRSSDLEYNAYSKGQARKKVPPIQTRILPSITSFPRQDDPDNSNISAAAICRRDMPDSMPREDEHLNMLAGAPLAWIV